MSSLRFSRGVSTLALCFAAASTTAFAQSATVIPDVNVNASNGGGAAPAASTPLRSAVPKDIPAVVQGVDKAQIETTVNALTSAETMKYLPDIEVRERAIGDRNGIIATRTTGTISSAESLLYADGILLSNLLGNSYSYPPRWGMVSVEEISRIDMMYGPFSALYPGNSMGGVATITTRMPEKYEFHAVIRGFDEPVSLFGTRTTFPGFNGDIAVGNKINDFSFWLTYDHLNAFGHPLNYDTVEQSATSAKAGTAVNGAIPYLDSNGKPAYILGSYSADHAIEDMAKAKLAYDFNPWLKAEYVLGLWGLNSNVGAVSNVTNATTGAPVYNTASGTVNIGGKNYAISSLNPSQAFATHVMQGLTLKSDSHGPFDYEAVISSYNYLRDRSLASTNYGVNNAGTDTHLDGSGWYTGDIRGFWRSGATSLGSHEVTVGAHYDQYQLRQNVYSETNWSSGGDGAVSSASFGDTRTEALYAQDVWSFLPKWKLTLGGREEYWQAYGGSNTNTVNTVNYPSQALNAFSPKASLSFQATPEFLLRASIGKAERFPTVTELYQSITSGGAIVVNNPALKPEDVTAYDLTGEYTFGKNVARVSGFLENRHNALFSQTDTSVTPNVTQIENINQVRIYGLETALRSKDVFIRGLDFMGSVTWANAKTLSDPQAPAAVGKNWPRIPEWRAKGVVSYNYNDLWSASLGVRYASASYSTLLNTDINSQVFGGISSYLVADARLTYKVKDNWTIAAGVDNIGDYKYYVSPHPYPQRTFFAEMRYDY